MDYEPLIDPTNLATVAAYLRNPRSPIQCVLHVRERALLAPLAAELDAAMEQPNATGRAVRTVIEQHLRDQRLAAELGIGEHLHSWPDKSLGSRAVLERVPDPAQFHRWLQQCWNRISAWPSFPNPT